MIPTRPDCGQVMHSRRKIHPCLQCQKVAVSLQQHCNGVCLPMTRTRPRHGVLACSRHLFTRHKQRSRGVCLHMMRREANKIWRENSKIWRQEKQHCRGMHRCRDGNKIWREESRFWRQENTHPYMWRDGKDLVMLTCINKEGAATGKFIQTEIMLV
jgi:hypothetical protein